MPDATLFVTRKFPPSVGGMETLANDVWATMSAGRPGRDVLVAHGGTNARMPLWLVPAAWTVAAAVLRRRVSRVLVGDVVLYQLLRPLLLLLRVPHATMAMGKDVVWTQPLYQWCLRRVLPHAPLVLAISRATADSVVAAGVDRSRVHIVRLGAEQPAASPGTVEARAAVRDRYAVPDSSLVVLTLGRLVRRKGVRWFVHEVLPDVDGVVYLVAGEGPEAADIEDAARRRGVVDRVRLLGAVSAQDKELLMRGSDVFVQPNVPVPGDMEGFGLVAVEAAMRGALVLAADLEGLRDAVVHEQTGLLLPAQDAGAWRRRLRGLTGDRRQAHTLAERYSTQARRRYDRELMGQQLHDVLAKHEAD